MPTEPTTFFTSASQCISMADLAPTSSPASKQNWLAMRGSRGLFAETCLQVTLIAESGLPGEQDAATPASIQSLSTPLRSVSRNAKPRQSSSRGNFQFAINRMKKKVGDFRFNCAVALVCSLLFAGLVAGAGAIISAFFLQSRPAAERREVATAPTPPVPTSASPSAPSSVPPTAPVVVARLGLGVDCAWSDEPSAQNAARG